MEKLGYLCKILNLLKLLNWIIPNKLGCTETQILNYFSWLPLNLVNLLNDLYEKVGDWTYYNLCFFIAHAIAMSSTCYNPFLYAWLNENFRKEFKQVLGGPCCSSEKNLNTTRSRRFLSERTCNGNETVQESFLPATSQPVIGSNVNPISRPPPAVLETIEEQTTNSQSIANVSVNYEQATARYSAGTNQVEVHIEVDTS